MTRSETLDGDVVLEVRDGYLHVWHRRSARDLVEAGQVLDAMDDALRASGLTRILFDSREAELSSREVGDRIWEWLSSHRGLDRVATIVKSELLAESVNMGGISRRMKIRGFNDEATALAWLLR